MRDLIKVSIRNVGRNKRRTLITVITVFIGVAMITGIRGLLNGLQNEIRSDLTRKLHGDLQIHKMGYKDSLEINPFQYLLEWNPQVEQKLLETEAVTFASPRFRVAAMLNHQKSQNTTSVFITAIDSKKELEVCPRFAQSIVDGAMLDSQKEGDLKQRSLNTDSLEDAVGLDESPIQSVQVENIQSNSFHQIMLTPTLMRGLNATVGDEVVLLLQDQFRMQQALVATIVGVVDFAVPNANAKMAWLDLKTVQGILGHQNEVSEIALRTADAVDERLAFSEVSATLSDDEFLETWQDLGGFLRDAINLQNVIFDTILVIVFAIVISAIVNTSLMTVMERVREIGTLMALGYKRIHIVSMFLIEASVIGLFGGLAGIVFSVSVLVIANSKGIDFTLPGQTLSTVLYPSTSPAFVVFILFVAIVSPIVASLVPALRASRMRPVQALSSN